MHEQPQTNDSRRYIEFNSTHGYIILTATILGASLVSLDGTIVTVALPQIQTEFNTSISGLQWLIDVYILFLTVPILVAGSLSDRYGRKLFFNIGLVGFTITSVACGAAATLDQLIVARIFQGISGAIMLPGSLAILNATFSPDVRGKTVGIWSAFTPLATAVGPLLGGWLVDNVSWRAAFYINLPIGIIALFMSWRFIPESKSRSMPESTDWWGAGLITVGLGAFIYSLIEGPKLGWTDPLVVTAIVAFIVCSIAFWLVETRIEHPMIPFALFKSRAFSGVTLVTFILFFAMSGVFFFLNLNLQQIQGFSATVTGLAFMPIIIPLFLMSQWVGRFVDRTGPRMPMIIGPIVIAIGFFWYMIPGTEANYWLTFFPATTIFGLGLGITLAPLTTVALSAVPIHLSGLASGVSNAVSRVATMLAVAMLGLLMVLWFSNSLAERTAPLDLTNTERELLQKESINLGGAEVPVELQSNLVEGVDSAIRESFVDAFRAMMGLCGILTLFGAWVSALTIHNDVIDYQAVAQRSSEFIPPH